MVPPSTGRELHFRRTDITKRACGRPPIFARRLRLLSMAETLSGGIGIAVTCSRLSIGASTQESGPRLRRQQGDLGVRLDPATTGFLKVKTEGREARRSAQDGVRSRARMVRALVWSWLSFCVHWCPLMSLHVHSCPS
jgi:hypothetical protein